MVDITVKLYNKTIVGLSDIVRDLLNLTSYIFLICEPNYYHINNINYIAFALSKTIENGIEILYYRYNKFYFKIKIFVFLDLIKKNS